jgi:hypothetical protein
MFDCVLASLAAHIILNLKMKILRGAVLKRLLAPWFVPDCDPDHRCGADRVILASGTFRFSGSKLASGSHIDNNSQRWQG